MSRKEKAEKGEKGERSETFNQLDERFQLQPHHDPNHIFPEELELIKELRRRRPELEKESDKFLCTFLFARRHDVDQTLELLDNYIAKRKELGFDVNPPTLKDEALRKHLETGVIFKARGSVDKYERLLHYVFVAKDRPKERPINVLYAYGFWETKYQIETETLRSLRNGSVLIVDFKGFGLSNVDLSPKGVEFSKALSGVFPKRIRKVYLIHGGWLLKLIMEAAKLLLSRKLSERVEFGNVDGLKHFITDEHLLSEYGGNCEIGIKDWVEDIKKEEDRHEKLKKEKDRLKYEMEKYGKMEETLNIKDLKVSQH
jgi:hypothetical protein